MKTNVFLTAAAVLLLAGGTVQAQSRNVVDNRPTGVTAVSSRSAGPDRDVRSRASEPSRVVSDRRQPAKPVVTVRGDASRVSKRNDIRMYNEKRIIVMERSRRELWPVSDYAIKAITGIRFDSDRLDLVRSLILDDGVFYSDQVLAIAKSFTFSSDKAKFLELVYESTVDKCNFYIPLGTLTFSSDRNRIMDNLITDARLYSDDLDIIYIPDKADVNAMVKKIKDVPFSSEKKKMALFMAIGGQLDARQIAQLADALTFENDKVDFLCKAYPYCVTPRDYDLAVRLLRYDSDRRRVLDEIRRPVRR
ncbi:MAG: DUF4476 domain-containing protein [Bacteroidaceae bacterium]|nr:DUF4476 domain-containing protein [Bacteroidaceae bacterium]